LENSFSNHLAPRGSCIVIGGADLLERPHETVCPKWNLRPGGIELRL